MVSKSQFSLNVSLDLAERLEVNPVTAIIHQHHRIGGDDLSKVLYDMKLYVILIYSSAACLHLISFCRVDRHMHSSSTDMVLWCHAVLRARL